MDFYLTELNQQNKVVHQLWFPMNPEEVTLTSGIITEDYSIINLGEVRLPKGNKLDLISWGSTLPGAALKSMPYVKSWRDPKELYKVLMQWKKKGQKLRLMITETPILMDVCIEEFDPTIKGGLGNIEYKISLFESKPMVIYTSAEVLAKNKAKSKSAKRPEPSSAKTYTVKKGDSLWKIAQSQLKKGSRYSEIQKLNLPSLKDPNKLVVGQVLKMPTA